MVDRDALIRYCNKLLDSGGFQDYCPNGLQVTHDQRPTIGGP